MERNILEEYIDACEVIKDIEKEIKKLKAKKMITANETVSGSNPEYPYNPQHFKVQGTIYTYGDDVKIRAQEDILNQRRKKAEELKKMISIPFRMQRIIKYRFFEDQSWQQVADRMGRRATAESVKKEFRRFLEKN